MASAAGVAATASGSKAAAPMCLNGLCGRYRCDKYQWTVQRPVQVSMASAAMLLRLRKRNSSIGRKVSTASAAKSLRLPIILALWPWSKCLNGLCGRCRCDLICFGGRKGEKSLNGIYGRCRCDVTLIALCLIGSVSQWPLRPVSLRPSTEKYRPLGIGSQWPLRPVTLRKSQTTTHRRGDV